MGENGEDVFFFVIGVVGLICGDFDIDKGGIC